MSKDALDRSSAKEMNILSGGGTSPKIKRLQPSNRLWHLFINAVPDGETL
jgi:hypothetical protein